ncbi:AUGMIN subunit 8-like [Cynara cardunculus var. scolymus]|uniref:AUGMIN subunit 8-like n=1 Tax=Cynara cardunculus var. scolymus TaxID=59895 RepID=UPI000D62883E|nr:AUGMIN subunit 8-like [Cynara cardunculus var. scolymus]
MDVHESDRSSNNPRPPSDLKESHIRSQSPTLTRIPSSNSTETSAVSSSTPHRSVSSEKRRHATLPSPWGLPTAAVHGVGAVARKVISNRLTESLWPSRRSSSSSHLQSDASSIPNAKRDNFSNESLSDHTSKTSLNVANEKTAKLPVSSKPTPEREKTHLKGKKSKPLGGSHVRPINQHRRPRKTNPNVIDQSENLKPSDGSDVSTINSNVIDQSENAKCPDGSDVNKIGSNVIDESENSKPPDGSDVNTKNSNVIDESENSKPPDGSDVNTTASNVIDESENLKPSDGSHVSTAGSNVIDQPENSKILDDPHVRSVNQNRWPSAIDSNVIGRSVNSKPPDSSHVRLVNQHRWSETIRSNVSDQSENSKAPDGSHGRLVNQHRWPGTIGSNVLNRNINPSNEVVKTCFTPDTGVNLKKMLPNYANKPIQESSSDAMNLLSSSLVDDGRISNLVSSSSQPSSPRKSYSLASRSVSSSRTRVNPSPASRGASLAPSKGVNYSPIVRGVSLTPATREVSLTRTSRGVSLTPTTRRVNPSPTIQEVDPLLPSKETDLSLATREVNPSLITRGGSPFPATRGVTPSLATREVSLTPTIKGTSLTPPERGVSPTPNAKSVSPPPENNTPITPSSPRQSYNSNTVSNSMGIGPYPIKEISLAPTRGVSPTPLKEMSHSLSTRGVSPSPSGRGVNTTSTRPSSPHQSSGSRLFFSSSILSMFTKYADRQKEKNKEDARRLDLLRNIQVQWQFVNASAEAVLDLQRVTAENSLFDMWRTILELWDSVAAMKMDINQLILQLKLYAILFRQMAYIDEWGLIQREYESALSVTTTDLYARTLRLPTTEGVQVDVKALKLAVSSVVQLMQTATSSIESTLSKLDGTHILASELAKIVSHERFLLDECEIFLASAAPLQIEECSLRSQLIQSKRE